MDQFYTVAEVAELLKYTEKHIRDWIRDGKLKAVKPGGYQWRISETELKRFMDGAVKREDPAKETSGGVLMLDGDGSLTPEYNAVPVKQPDESKPAPVKEKKQPVKSKGKGGAAAKKQRKQTKTAKEKKIIADRKRKANEKARESVKNNEITQAKTKEERDNAVRELSKAYYYMMKQNDEREKRENINPLL